MSLSPLSSSNKGPIAGQNFEMVPLAGDRFSQISRLIKEGKFGEAEVELIYNITLLPHLLKGIVQEDLQWIETFYDLVNDLIPHLDPQRLSKLESTSGYDCLQNFKVDDSVALSILASKQFNHARALGDFYLKLVKENSELSKKLDQYLDAVRYYAVGIKIAQHFHFQNEVDYLHKKISKILKLLHRKR